MRMSSVALPTELIVGMHVGAITRWRKNARASPRRFATKTTTLKHSYSITVLGQIVGQSEPNHSAANYQAIVHPFSLPSIPVVILPLLDEHGRGRGVESGELRGRGMAFAAAVS
jgi:hypothetical protein